MVQIGNPIKEQQRRFKDQSQPGETNFITESLFERSASSRWRQHIIASRAIESPPRNMTPSHYSPASMSISLLQVYVNALAARLRCTGRA